ncbi:MAG: VWA domain-containing protein [Myxococcota bacterium]
MKSFVYSRWDGSQEEFRLDAERALDALSDLLMEGLDAREALEWMRQHGFELAGLDMRVMGVDELVAELREQAQELYDRYRMDRALDELRRRLEDILDREQQALRSAHGFESSRMNEFLSRRHAEEPGLADTLERFRDYEFDDEEAGADYQELLEELEAIRDLERFLGERGERFRGPEPADYGTAQQVREQIEALEEMARNLAEGNFESLSPEELAELLGSDAARSLVMLRDLESTLDRAGYLRPGQDGPELTPRAIRRIGAQALADVYGSLRKDRPGEHEIDVRGAALPVPDQTRPYVFGDPLELDVTRTLLNAVKRGVPDGFPVRLELGDFELREMDHATHSTTVLLLDMSWSMSWAGRFAAAKRVALALDHLVRTRFPRDRFFVVGFSTRAREIGIRELPEVTWDMGEPFTNLQEGLMVAERLIAQHPSKSPQVIVITDGQPTAYFLGKELHVEWPMGFGGVSPHAVAETLKTVRRISGRGITINTFMLDDSPELLGFVEHMTLVNRGRAFYTDPAQLGSYVMVDYLNGRRKKRS